MYSLDQHYGFYPNRLQWTKAMTKLRGSGSAENTNLITKPKE
ncbi:MAG: hypothetical protein ACI9P7_001335, partial [Candidatus Azotimanducaceae bacterium]